MRGIEQLENNWEGLAKADPLWAILGDPTRKGGKWAVPEFRDTGVGEILTVAEYLQALGVEMNTRGSVLDFGCGVGRLTQALALHFASCTGVDISSTMVARAKELNTFPDKCSYIVNKSSDLRQFEDSRFDFIYSSIVLQHIEPVYSQAYLREFVRVLKVGGYAVFQMLDSLRQPRPTMERVSKSLTELRIKFAVRRRLHGLFPRYVAARQEPPSFASDVFEMDMHCVPESTIRRLVSETGGRVIDVIYTNSTDADFNGHLRYFKEEPQATMICKQYCVRKEA